MGTTNYINNKNTISLLLAILVSAILSPITESNAEQVGVYEIVPAGQYEKYNAWSAVRLAATGLASPKRLAMTTVVYAYPVTDLYQGDPQKLEAIEAIARASQYFVVEDKNTGAYVQLPKSDLDKIADPEKFAKFVQEKSPILLSYDPELLGVKPSSKLINWRVENKF